MSSTIDYEIMHLLRARRYFEEKILEIDNRLRQIARTYERAVPVEMNLDMTQKINRT